MNEPAIHGIRHGTPEGIVLTTPASDERRVIFDAAARELRRQRLGTVVRELAADLVAERRRRLVLEREVRVLRTRLAAYEASESSAPVEHQASSER